MELSLNRIDLHQVGITNPRCLRILRSSKRSSTNTPLTEKIVVGDVDGVVTCFGMKGYVVSIAFKTLPGPAISGLSLDTAETANSNSKIFVSTGPEIRGYTKKGKHFLQFDTNLTETISSLFVSNNDLIVSCSYTFNHYKQCVDTNYYLSPDAINDLVLIASINYDSNGEEPSATSSDVSTRLLTVIACQDRVLRLLDHSTMLYEVEVPGPPACIMLYQHTGGLDGDEILYGTSDGKIGLVKMGLLAPSHKWDLTNDKKLGGIVCLDMYDMSRDGKEEILVARDDGEVEIYALDEISEPRIIANYSLCEGLTSIQGGLITQTSHPEAVISTYSGKLLLLSTAPSEGASKLSSEINKTTDSELNARIESLNQEICELEAKVQQGREAYEQSTDSSTAISALPRYSVNTKFTLHPEDASYTLAVELHLPIESVILQSNVPIDLLDIDKNTAVASHCQCDPDQNNYMLATYRCQSNTTRLELKLRSIEGQYGTLQVYVTPRMQPKSCCRKQFPIKPLSLHQRTHLFEESRPLNNLTLTGSFNINDMHSLITFCLMEVPERPPSEEFVNMHFRSTFLDTQLDIVYRDGEAIFRSDNISTISILKDVLSKRATEEHIQLDMSCKINDESVPFTLQLIHPKLDYQLILAKRVHIIDALQEIQAQEKDISFLAADYLFILERADKLREEFKKQPCHLDRLYGMITDLYIDKFKFKGMNVKSRVGMLLDLLENNYELRNLLSFFEEEYFD